MPGPVLGSEANTDTNTRVFMPLQSSLSGKPHVIECLKNFDTLGGVEKTKQNPNSILSLKNHQVGLPWWCSG